jgi:acetate kinase
MNARRADLPGGEAILSVNAGSSSLKFGLYPVVDDEIGAAVLSGTVEGLEPNGHPGMRVVRDGQASELALRVGSDESPFDAALRAVMATLDDAGAPRLLAVAHRVVHGGNRYCASVAIDAQVLAFLQTLEPLAPLHQPHNLTGVRAFLHHGVEVPQVACFDTAFHAHAPEIEQRFALPDALWTAGIRRYGFHGLSYAYVLRALQQRTTRAGGRLVLAHLGNGASACAVDAGRSIASTMGFSALDGLMMGTRCGALDAGVLLHLMRHGMDAAAIERLLYKESGLLGVSGLSADMRTLRASDAPGAQRAIEMFTHRIVREAGALAACLGGVDLLAFTGGIGEHDAALRSDVARRLAFLGVVLDEAANRNANGSAAVAIQAADSAAEVWVVPTDEGRVAAADALAIVRGAAAMPAGLAPSRRHHSPPVDAPRPAH